MSDKPRRAWFQIHLSTAIVLMVVAGGLCWINTRVNRTEQKESIFSSIVSEGRDIDKSTYYGWPCDSFFELSIIEKDGKEYFYGSPIRQWFVNGVIIDSLFAMAALFVVWYACEFRIRHREARAP